MKCSKRARPAGAGEEDARRHTEQEKVDRRFCYTSAQRWSCRQLSLFWHFKLDRVEYQVIFALVLAASWFARLDQESGHRCAKSVGRSL